MPLARPVTVPNVACELFKRVAQESLYELYQIECDVKPTEALSAYLWIYQTDCDLAERFNCLVRSLPVNTFPCTSRSSSLVCNISITPPAPYNCPSIILVPGAIAISDNNS